MVPNHDIYCKTVNVCFSKIEGVYITLTLDFFSTRTCYNKLFITIDLTAIKSSGSLKLESRKSNPTKPTGHIPNY